MNAHGRVEVRFDAQGIDEVISETCDVHLERMSDSEFALIVSTRTERVCINLTARWSAAQDDSGLAVATIIATEAWREPERDTP